MSEILHLSCSKPGLFTSIQDRGRPAHQHLGVPIGGVLDRRAAAQANLLVGNPPEEPLLEITLAGPSLHFDQACQIAITGADLSAKLNGNPIALNRTISVEADSTLGFGFAQRGCRGYMAVGGRWQVKKWLGSASLATQEWELLTPDSKIEKGSVIKIVPRDVVLKKQLPPRALQLDNPTELKVLPGPEFERMERQEIAWVFSQTFTIGSDSNRMGVRLEPASSTYRKQEELISSGIIPGTVQVTNAGQLIVLLADAHTVGGYPRFLQLTRESLLKIAQLKPGDRFRFSFQSYDALAKANA